ncbi:hypothetical protein [Hydrogenophaga sp.]|uniref:hypothetical protein n=1 Tax=Hydrogenophaga sp. TaxID=1904254 RepID=UPI003FA598F1
MPALLIIDMSRTPGSPLAPLPHEHVVEKNVPDAFVNMGLERWLHARGGSALVIVDPL